MEVYSFLNFLGEKVVSSSSPTFVTEIAEFVTSATSKKTNKSKKGSNNNILDDVALSPARRRKKLEQEKIKQQLGNFSSLFTPEITYENMDMEKKLLALNSSSQTANNNQMSSAGSPSLLLSQSARSTRRGNNAHAGTDDYYNQNDSDKNNQSSLGMNDHNNNQVNSNNNETNIPVAVVVGGVSQMNWSSAAALASSSNNLFHRTTTTNVNKGTSANTNQNVNSNKAAVASTLFDHHLDDSSTNNNALLDAINEIDLEQKRIFQRATSHHSRSSSQNNINNGTNSIFLPTRVVVVPNDADRVSDLVLEVASIANAAYLQYESKREARLQSASTLLSSSSSNNNNYNQRGSGGYKMSSSSAIPVTTSSGMTPGLASSSNNNNNSQMNPLPSFRRQRIVLVFHMGETTQAASEEMSALSASLVELLSCRVRFGRFCSFSAMVVVRSPWYASVLLSALTVPPLHGALAARVFESETTSSAGSNSSNSTNAVIDATFPQMLMMTLRHFPFCVMSEDLFRSVCVAWNCAHRMQDLIHSLHHVIRLHLFHFPDLNSEGNRANVAAVQELIAFSGDVSSASINVDLQSLKTTASSSVPNPMTANSFTTLYYEVLVRRNIMILSSGQATTRKRQRLIKKLVSVLPDMCSVTGAQLARRRHRSKMEMNLSGMSGSAEDEALKVRNNVYDENNSNNNNNTGKSQEGDDSSSSSVSSNDNSDDDDEEILFSLPQFQYKLHAKLEKQRTKQLERLAQRRFEHLQQPKGFHKDQTRKNKVLLEFDQQEDADDEADESSSFLQKIEEALEMEVENQLGQNGDSENYLDDDDREKQLGAPDAMLFPAVTVSAVASFLEHPGEFFEADEVDDHHNAGNNNNNNNNEAQSSDENAGSVSMSSDVAKLLCVLYRHFRNGISVSQLKDALGDRRRTLIAVHEACAAGLVSVRVDSGNIKVI